MSFGDYIKTNYQLRITRKSILKRRVKGLSPKFQKQVWILSINNI